LVQWGTGETGVGCARFALKFFSLKSEIKRNWIRFTCVSLVHYKFTSIFSLLFAYFHLKFFASLHFSNFRFEAKQSEAKFKSIFPLFCFISFFSLFFALNFSLRFHLVIFPSKQNKGENLFASKEAKFNIFCIISLPNFVLGEKNHSYRFFRLIFAYFTFVFASDFWCFTSK
jgi:hypothetical protein